MPVAQAINDPSKASGNRVVIVCSNVGNNCMGRALLLGALLARRGDLEVNVVGVNLGSDVWPPSAGFGVPIASRRLSNALQYPAAARWLRSQLLGARVIVSKPMFTSLGLTRLAGVADDHLLLDIDDWEVGLFRTPGRLKNVWDWVRPGKLNSFWSTHLLDRSVARCPHRIVSNRWLEARFGGTLLPHVRDTTQLRPDAEARNATRTRLRMGNRFWVGYVGTIRKHKGVNDLLEAVLELGEGFGLYLAGVDESHAYAADLVARARAELGPERLRLVNEFPFDQLGSWLSAADVLCMPSRDDEAAIGQIPAKLFDAMAMGLPILATSISDMPEILGDGAGIIVPPAAPGAIADAIRSLAGDAQRQQRFGARARQKAVDRYSYVAAADLLWEVLSQVPVALPR